MPLKLNLCWDSFSEHQSETEQKLNAIKKYEKLVKLKYTGSHFWFQHKGCQRTTDVNIMKKKGTWLK